MCIVNPIADLYRVLDHHALVSPYPSAMRLQYSNHLQIQNVDQSHHSPEPLPATTTATAQRCGYSQGPIAGFNDPEGFALENQFVMVRGDTPPRIVYVVNGGAVGMACAATATTIGVELVLALSPVPSSNEALRAVGYHFTVFDRA